jgi:DNA repair exonuclease SbcCD ATPase subunit
MSEEATPVQQDTPPAQPEVDWEARYKGSVKKIDEKHAELKVLQEKLNEANARVAELEANQSQLSTTQTVQQAEWQKKVEELTEKTIQLNAEIEPLRAEKAKAEIARSMGAAHLFPILDRIPYSPDPDVQKQIIKDFSDWGKNLTQETEQRLLAGSSPSIPTVDPQEKSVPQSADQWQRHVNSLPLGSKERADAMSQMFQFMKQAS